jgi:hypothetical protein
MFRILLSGTIMPSIQNETGIQNYIQKKKINPNNIFYLHNDVFFEKFKNSQRQPNLFDKNGYEVIYNGDTTKTKCLGTVENFLRSYQLSDSVLLDSGRTFAQETRFWQYYKGEPVVNPPRGGDLTIVYYWNTYAGDKKNKNFFNEIEKICKERPDLEILFYKINCDVREEWALKYLISEPESPQNNTH